MLIWTTRRTPGFDGRVQQRSGILHGGIVGDAAAGVADPVGVVQGIGPLETCHQSCEIGEVQWPGFHLIAEGTAGRRIPGQSPHPVAPIQQPVGNIPASVAEGASDDTKTLRVSHWLQSFAEFLFITGWLCAEAAQLEHTASRWLQRKRLPRSFQRGSLQYPDKLREGYGVRPAVPVFGISARGRLS